MALMNQKNRQVDLAEERTELAAEHTRDALDRTLVAWICTTLTKIGFGLFKMFEYDGVVDAHEMRVTKVTTLSPRVIGAVLVLMLGVAGGYAPQALNVVT